MLEEWDLEKACAGRFIVGHAEHQSAAELWSDCAMWGTWNVWGFCTIEWAVPGESGDVWLFPVCVVSHVFHHESHNVWIGFKDQENILMVCFSISRLESFIKVMNFYCCFHWLPPRKVMSCLSWGSLICSWWADPFSYIRQCHMIGIECLVAQELPLEEKQQAWLQSGSLHCSGTKSPANLIPEQRGNKLKGAWHDRKHKWKYKCQEQLPFLCLMKNFWVGVTPTHAMWMPCSLSCPCQRTL